MFHKVLESVIELISYILSMASLHFGAASKIHCVDFTLCFFLIYFFLTMSRSPSPVFITPCHRDTTAVCSGESSLPSSYILSSPPTGMAPPKLLSFSITKIALAIAYCSLCIDCWLHRLSILTNVSYNKRL
jgi:hypothetical protein